MPKKPRQAHIPSAATRRRRGRRPSAAPEPPRFASEPFGETAFDAGPVGAAAAESGLVVPRSRRRLDLLRNPDEGVPLRNVPGQLPTFERAYLMRELRQIGVTSGSLLGLIVVLALLLR